MNSGLALIRTSIHTVVGANPLDMEELPGKLDNPVAWALRLEDGDVVDIAISAADAHLLTGSPPLQDQESVPLRRLPVPETHASRP